MKKRLMLAVFVFLIAFWVNSNMAFCQSMNNEEIMKELKVLKERITKLEEELAKKDGEIEKLRGVMAKSQEEAKAVEEQKEKKGPLERIGESIQFSGLLEFGGVRDSVRNRDGTDLSQSDLALTTVQLNLEAEVNEWVHVCTSLLYEDPTFGNETSVDLDVATVTIGNPEKFPLFFTAGALYVPFGALFTHFPDDPLIDQPLTLLMGETREKAALLGLKYKGFSLSGYIFNGDMDEGRGENHIEHFGFDARYDFGDKNGIEVTTGASYISNIADSNGLTDALQNTLGVNTIRDCVGGFDAYLHLGFAQAFLEAEFMTATDRFHPTEIVTIGGDGARPAVWNLEVGYNLNWGKNLEIAFQYAGSDETEALGWPERRYGVALNQEIFPGIIGSLAYFKDEFHTGDWNGRDRRNVVLGQIAVNF